MPKMKSHKATRKRVKITAKGKVKRGKAGGRHLLSGKSAKRKRHLKQRPVQSGRPGKKLVRMAGGS